MGWGGGGGVNTLNPLLDVSERIIYFKNNNHSRNLNVFFYQMSDAI